MLMLGIKGPLWHGIYGINTTMLHISFSGHFPLTAKCLKNWWLHKGGFTFVHLLFYLSLSKTYERPPVLLRISDFKRRWPATTDGYNGGTVTKFSDSEKGGVVQNSDRRGQAFTFSVPIELF